jgi:hypothetical protein
MAKTLESLDSRQNGQMAALEEEVERYRRASEDSLQQLDWCIGYLHGCGKKAVAAALAHNRSHIRLHLLQRSEQPVPTQRPSRGGGPPSGRR